MRTKELVVSNRLEEGSTRIVNVNGYRRAEIGRILVKAQGSACLISIADGDNILLVEDGRNGGSRMAPDPSRQNSVFRGRSRARGLHILVDFDPICSVKCGGDPACSGAYRHVIPGSHINSHEQTRVLGSHIRICSKSCSSRWSWEGGWDLTLGKNLFM